VAVEDRYPGTFETYTAGVISAWQNRKQTDRLRRLRADLEELGLTWKVEAKQLDDTQVELMVGRLPRAQRGGAQDLVNIADVGFGVSQTLPVIVALLAAEPAQLVYLEQPEIHLHPRAQVTFANLLARAVDRGVRVVVETHSALLVRAVQTLVAKQQLRSEDVILHWFSRDPRTGDTDITTGELDAAGAFGDWPEDFDEVYLNSEASYLDAAGAATA
jgi:predicted ATPase